MVCIAIAEWGNRFLFQCIKGLPIAMLLIMLGPVAASDAMQPVRRLRMAGLVASLGGGVILETSFSAGTVVFALAQLCYCLSLPWRTVSMRSLLISGTFALVLYLAVVSLIVPGITDAWPPLILFYGAIESLVLAGALASLRASRRICSPEFMAAGICLFVLSDSILAVDRWHTPIPGAVLMVQAAYFAGQFLIASSVLPRALPQTQER